MPWKVPVTGVRPGSPHTELTRSWWRWLAATEGWPVAATKQDRAAGTAVGRIVTANRSVHSRV